MKALAMKQEDRYRSIKSLQADIEAYQSGFATSVEHAGTWTQFTLLVKRNKGIFTAIAAALVVILAGSAAFMVRVMASERKATANYRTAEDRLTQLKGTVPVFVAQARELTEEQDFKGALEILEPALELAPDNADLWRQKGDLLQSLLQLEEATAAYDKALELAPDNLLAGNSRSLCKELLKIPKTGSEVPPQWVSSLYDLFMQQSRTAEAAAMLGRMSGDKAELWKKWKPVFDKSGLKGTLTQNAAGGFILRIDKTTRDLSPLRMLSGMPLSSMDMSEAVAITDIAPLKGFPLQDLSLRQTSVSDLSALEGMPLHRLFLDRTNVKDLSPLKGSPLTAVGLSTTGIIDLWPLHGMAITNLSLFSCTAVSDLGPLKGMPLKGLSLYMAQNIRDITPLKGAPLRVLDMAQTAVSDLSPLRGMKLEWFAAGGPLASINDLTPLKGMPLKWLRVDGPITDISALQGLPLETAYLYLQNLVDINPLHGSPLKTLILYSTKLSDLSPLEGMQLEHIAFSPANITHGIDVLRKMPSLRTLSSDNENNRIPAAEFWKRYDAGAVQEEVESSDAGEPGK